MIAVGLLALVANVTCLILLSGHRRGRRAPASQLDLHHE